MSNLPLCDKCNQPVAPDNDAHQLMQLLGYCEDRLVFNGDPNLSRHILPTGSYEGSPSIAQYLEGQPRDSRESRWWVRYDPQQEIKIRAAYGLLTGQMLICHPPSDTTL